MDTQAQENSELLAVNNKSQRNGNARQEEITIGPPQRNGTARQEEITLGPPDGGLRAFAVLIGSFLTNGLLFGTINCYSVIYEVLEKQLRDDGVSNTESKASLVGSLTLGTTFFLSPLSGVLTGILGLRLTAVLGGFIATAGLIIASFVTHSVGALYFTYGIMFGVGASFAYTPSLAILGHYFKKHLGLANGIVTIGSSVFTVIMPSLMDHMLLNYGIAWLFRLLAVTTFGVAMCGLLFKPTPLMTIKSIREYDSCKSLLKSIINTDIWRNRKYRYWALSMPVALFGYFVPYVHIINFMKVTFQNVNRNLPIQCIAISSGAGRLVFGFLADRPGIDRIMLQQISFYVFGTLTIILPFVTSFPLLVVLSLGMGLFDGALIALIGPIAFELCGASNAAQAIGCMLGIVAPPLSIGPPLAGLLYSIQSSYTLPFVLAGMSPLIGATLMFAIRFQKCRREQPDANGHAVAMSSVDADLEKSPVPLLTNGKINQQQTKL